MPKSAQPSEEEVKYLKMEVASAIVSVENGLPYKLKEKQKCALTTLGNGGTCLPLLTYWLREKRVFFPIAQYS